MIMLDVLKDIDLIMTSDETISLRDLIAQSDGLTIDEIKAGFYNRNTLHSPYLMSTLRFLVALELLAIRGSKYYVVGENDTEFELLRKAIDALYSCAGDELFYEDYLTETYYSDIKWTNILPACKNILIGIGFYNEVRGNRYYVDNNYASLIESHKSKMTQKKLESILDKQKESGLKAERYILEYEKMRLINSPYKDRIRQISTYDVTAGFDIVSLDLSSPDRTIQSELR